MAEHCRVDHKGTKVTPDDFKFDLTGQYRTPLQRQAAESVQLMQLVLKNEKQTDTIDFRPLIMNSRSEFHQPIGAFQTRTRRIQEYNYNSELI